MTGTFSYFETEEFIGLATAPAVSAAGRARVFFNTASGQLEVSKAGAAYVTLGGASGLQLPMPLAGFEAVTAGSPELVSRNNHLLLGFDAAAVESVTLKNRMSTAYNPAANVTGTVTCFAASAITGNAVVRLEFERIEAGVTDIDADSFDAAVEVTVAAAGTSGVSFAAVFTLPNTDMDGLLAGELFRVKVSRVGTSGSDTMAGDLQIQDLVLTQ